MLLKILKTFLFQSNIQKRNKEQLYYCVYLEDGLASIDFTLGIIRWEFYIF